MKVKHMVQNILVINKNSICPNDRIYHGDKAKLDYISSPENETISILQEIISNGSCVFDKVEKHILFDEDEVSTDPHLLSFKFIQQDFNIDLFKNYFTKESWETVDKLYADKLNLSACPECSEFYISKSKTILCKVCRVFWQIKCHIPKFSNFYQNNKTNWDLKNSISGCKILGKSYVHNQNYVIKIVSFLHILRDFKKINVFYVVILSVNVRMI